MYSPNLFNLLGSYKKHQQLRYYLLFINRLTGLCCIRIGSKNVKKVQPITQPSCLTIPPLKSTSREEQILEFIEEQKQRQEAIIKRKASFVQEFRDQLVRVPLQHRVNMAPQRKQSFVISDTSNRSRLSSYGSRQIRQKRTVTNWARNRQIEMPRLDAQKPRTVISSVLLGRQPFCGSKTRAANSPRSSQFGFDDWIRLTPLAGSGEIRGNQVEKILKQIRKKSTFMTVKKKTYKAADKANRREKHEAAVVLSVSDSEDTSRQNSEAPIGNHSPFRYPNQYSALDMAPQRGEGGHSMYYN